MEHGPEGNTHPHITPHAAMSEANSALSRAREAAKVEGKTGSGVEWTLTPPFLPDAPRYPHVSTHLWGAWPVLAIETGGYNDLEAEDPSTGRTLWARVFAKDRSVYDALRLLIDAMEAARFLDGEQQAGA